jgi:hypothetical protein
MRTALYVLKPTTVTIRPRDPHDRDVTITPYNPQTPSRSAGGAAPRRAWAA